MKKSILFLFAVVLSVVVMAQPPKGEATKGMVFGEKTKFKGAIDVNELPAKLDKTKSADVVVKGKVVEVCSKMGCWIKMETDKGNLMVKMKDHEFFVPMDLNGKTIIVNGTATLTVTPESELKHYAEDAGKSKAEIEKIKGDKKEIVLDAKGILVL